MSADRGSWPHLHELDLADPKFLARDPVNLLLGADVYASILQEGVKKGSPYSPIAQRICLGWIISELARKSEEETEITTNHCSVGEELSTLVRQLWEQEELPTTLPPLSAADNECEKFFARTHSRSTDGRYIVRLRVATALPDFSDTHQAAIRLLHAMERRFKVDAPFRDLYLYFIKEYEDLEHMTEVQSLSATEAKRARYLPHHGVIREASQSTKLRVVFNSSQRIRTGDSLN